MGPKEIVDPGPLQRTIFLPKRFNCLETTLNSNQTCLNVIDTFRLNKSRMRSALTAVLTLSLSPRGFVVSEFASKVQSINGQSDSQYGKWRAAYDLKKLRGKKLLEISGRRYKGTAEGFRTIAAVSVLRDRVIQPLLAGAGKLKTGRRPKYWSSIDEHYRTLCLNMQCLFNDLGIAA
jgi:hypothetical protein